MLFEPPSSGPTKMSMPSLYFHVLLYYDTFYTMVLIPFQIFLFIYKYNSLVYSTNTIVGELILIVLALFINWLRLDCGKIANKGKSGARYAIYFIATAVIIVGFVYIVVWQPYVYWLEFIQAIIALIILAIEFITGIISLIAYKIAQ
jgi:hypothetical protein